MIALLIFTAVQAAQPQVRREVRHEPEPPESVTGGNTCLPMKLADGLPVVTGTIGGRKVSLGFDTGAPGGPILDPAIIADLKVTQIGEAGMTDPSRKNVVTVPLYQLEGLKMGNVTIGKWTMSARPPRESRRFAEPDGIIGLTAFAGYVVTIDYPGGRMLLTKGRLPEPNGKTSFHYEGPIPRVPLNIDGNAIEAHIDTGNARYALIVPEEFAAKLSGFGNRFPIGIARTINNRFDLMALPVRDAKVGEFPLFAGTIAYPAPATRGNVGSPILKDLIVKVDPANRIVALERAAPGLENGCPTA